MDDAGNIADDVAAATSMDPGAFGLPFVLNFWKEFELEKARTNMDEQGLKVAENQEQSSKNRKKLAQATKDFKKASPAEQPKLFVALLKSYQEEVDNLTLRSKFAEGAFLGLYQKLYEAPDPVPALASATEAAAKVERLTQEKRKMSAELEEFRTESSHLKNQQATVRRLEERNRQLEQMMEEKVQEMVAMKQQVLAEENKKGLDALKEREEALQEQLRVARDSLQNMQRLHEMGQAQLFEVKAKSEEEKADKQYELNLLTDEVERAQARLLSLEREKESLKAQLKDGAGPQQVGPTLSEAEGQQHSWEAGLRAKEAIISELHAELHSLETHAAEEREQHLSEIRRLHAAIQEKEDRVQELHLELSVRPSTKQWEDLRKQVKILQAVGYNAVEGDDWDEAGDGAAPTPSRSSAGNAGPSGGESVGRLEALLLDKNRKMEHELTRAKVQLSEKREQASALEDKVKALQGQVEDQRRLIQKLEDDILKGYSKSSDGLGLRSMGSPRRDPLAGIVGLDPAAAAGSRGRAKGGEEAERAPGPLESGEDADSVLAVVCAQRDRFRQRITVLEEELGVTRDKCSRLQRDAEKLKADNVKLYERMRYVQAYTHAPGKPNTPQNRSRKHAVDMESGDVEQKYKKMYEDGLNPFAAFSTKEKELRYKELGLRDWIALTSGKFLLSNKHARTFVFFYSIALHLLVFFSMYRMSHHSHQSIKYDTHKQFTSHHWLPAPVLNATLNATRSIGGAIAKNVTSASSALAEMESLEE